MTINDLLSVPLEESVSVFNQPFTYVGRSEITLDDGSKIYWLYNDEEDMLLVSPEDEELALFDHLEDEINPDDSIFYRGKEYEFSYESAGIITSIEGEAETEQDDRYIFSEYQSLDGERLLLINNENTGEVDAFLGKTVSEDDLSEI